MKTNVRRRAILAAAVLVAALAVCLTPYIQRLSAARRIDPLVTQLRSDDASTRKNASAQLSKARSAVEIDRLIWHLGDPSGGSSPVVDAIAGIGQPAVRPVLETVAGLRQLSLLQRINRLLHMDRWLPGRAGARLRYALVSKVNPRELVVQENLQRLLVKMGPSVVEGLLGLAASDGRDVREIALTALRDIHDPRAADVFIRALSDPDLGGIAASALVQLDWECGRILQYSSPTPQQKAVWQAYKAKEPSILDAMMTTIRSPGRMDPMVPISLLRFTDRPAVAEFIAKTLADESVSWSARKCMADNLHADTDPPALFDAFRDGRRAKVFLEWLSSDDLFTRQAAAGPLGFVPDDVKMPAIIEAISHGDANSRDGAVRFFYHNSDAKYIAPLARGYPSATDDGKAAIADFLRKTASWRINANLPPRLRDELNAPVESAKAACKMLGLIDSTDVKGTGGQ